MSKRASSKNAITRRSYSAGCASSPPTCPASGTSQIAFGSPRVRVERPVGGLLDRLTPLAVDEEHRTRRDLRHEAPQVGRRQVVGEEGRRGRGHAVSEHLLPRPYRVREDVAHRTAARALRHDRLERRRLGGRLDHHLAADGEADAADPLGVDVGAALQEGDGRVDVTLSLPAERVRVALALALAATVEEQHAVTVAGQHPRLVLRSGPAGERDHGRAVLRRDVPALQLQAVARGELDVLVGGPEFGPRHLRARGMRDDVANREGDEDRHRSDRRRDGEHEPPAVPPPQPIVRPPRPPQRDDPDTEQQEAREYRQQTRVVVARRPDRPRVVDSLRAGEHAEEAQQERDRPRGRRRVAGRRARRHPPAGQAARGR